MNHNLEFKAIHVSIVYDHLQLHVIQFIFFEITIMVLHHHNKYTCACIVIDLCHAAAILFQEIKKKLCICTASVVLTARLAVELLKSLGIKWPPRDKGQ